MHRVITDTPLETVQRYLPDNYTAWEVINLTEDETTVYMTNN